MITGGTGSFGNTRAQALHEHRPGRDPHLLARREEAGRHAPPPAGEVARARLQGALLHRRRPQRQSVRDAMHGVDYIFHAAALKQVPSCEFFPMEAVRTNVIGTDNVLHAAIEEGVDRVVCLSTDKAAYPINAMGKSKAMMESIIYANARNGAGRTTICCTRYGNVMCSRGSVIPLFIDPHPKGRAADGDRPQHDPLPHEPGRGRRPRAVRLRATPTPATCSSGRPPASTIGDLAEAVQEVFGRVGTQVIGTRHGEKLYETLMTREGAPARRGTWAATTAWPATSRDLNYGQVRRRRRGGDPGRRVLHLPQHREARRGRHHRQDRDRRVRAAGARGPRARGGAVGCAVLVTGARASSAGTSASR